MTYKQRKQVRELIKGARKLQHANSDILPAKDSEQLTQAIEALSASYQKGDDGPVEKCVEALEKLLEKLFPRKKDHRIRENVEVLLVAVVVAMAVRTYFLQPFKIPTGSMQPTLYGIHSPSAEYPPGEDMEKPTPFPFSIFEWLIWGKTYAHDPKAAPGAFVRITGDHIFVDKVTYNFRRPKRGEVIVFETHEIKGLDQDKFYIKRCVGLPGNDLKFDPPFLFVNGKKLEGGPFDRIYSMENGYHGYKFPGSWRYQPALSPEGEFSLGPKCYFACGDNSANSLDSRYWGCVPEANLVGRAFWTYWPASRRWGLVR